MAGAGVRQYEQAESNAGVHQREQDESDVGCIGTCSKRAVDWYGDGLC